MKTPVPVSSTGLRLKPLVTALAASAGLLAPALGHALSNQELLKELQALKDRIQQLEDKLQQNAARPAPAVAPAVSVEDFNRVSMKVEAAEDAQETSGMKGLKISGMMDPTFVYNNRQNTSGFNFLNNFNVDASSGDGYTYYNSYFGMAMLDLQKETEGGQKWRLTLSPHKSASSGYNTSTIVHEASVSVPLEGPANKLIAGQIPDWSGYEYIWSNLQPLISHNLLFDFTIPSYYTGAGMEMTRGKWIGKFLVGNINQTVLTSGDKTQGLSYRADYAINEFSGFGFAGTSAQANSNSRGFNLFEIDGYYTRGDLTLQGQIGRGQLGGASLNSAGDYMSWSGASGLVAYKVTPRLQLVTRADYINNSSNGGGVLGANASNDPSNGNLDSYNGFGTPANGSGVNRYALSVGFNYLITPNHTANSGTWNTSTWFKMELRADGANGLVFYDAVSDSYKRDSLTLLSSMVFAF
ncbi:MAG: DUF3138 family protein [Limnohabitans sp.]|nr:DUF3138 family protein [Limnohabitans sp.]